MFYKGTTLLSRLSEPNEMNALLLAVMFLFLTIQTSFTKDCRVDSRGTNYRGTYNISREGACVKWSDSEQQKTYGYDFSGSPAQSDLDAQNYVRNTVTSDNNSQPFYGMPICWTNTGLDTTNADSLWSLAAGGLVYCNEGGPNGENCLNDDAGVTYLGSTSVTENNVNCLYWSDKNGGISSYNRYSDTSFADCTAAAAANYCRNPTSNGVASGTRPWCYTSTTGSFGYCNIVQCNSLIPNQCRNDRLGNNFRGSINTTYDGTSCIRWDSTWITAWPLSGETISSAANSCRNPNNSPIGLWCYVSSNPLVWKPCMVKACSVANTCNQVSGVISNWNYALRQPVSSSQDECNATNSGQANSCDINFTIEGNPCENWLNVYNQASGSFYGVPGTSSFPSIPPSSAASFQKQAVYFHPANLPDETMGTGSDSALNYCRNPDEDPLGPWCFYKNTNSQFVKGYCWTPCLKGYSCWSCNNNVLDTVQNTYTGTVAKTRTGLTCQSWVLTEFVNDLFPDGCAIKAKNYCRNPDSRNGGAWCFILNPPSPTFIWDFCDLSSNLCPVCVSPTPAPNVCTSYPSKNASVVCYSDTRGVSYTGTKNTTISGKTCQAWSVQTPHQHQYSNPTSFGQDASSISCFQNFCRNPNNDSTGPWCFTTNSATTNETCAVPSCASIGLPVSIWTLVEGFFVGVGMWAALNMALLSVILLLVLASLNAPIQSKEMLDSPQHANEPQAQKYPTPFIYTVMGPLKPAPPAFPFVPCEGDLFQAYSQTVYEAMNDNEVVEPVRGVLAARIGFYSAGEVNSGFAADGRAYSAKTFNVVSTAGGVYSDGVVSGASASSSGFYSAGAVNGASAVGGGLYNVGAVGGSSAEGGGFYTTGEVRGVSTVGGGFYSAGAVNGASAVGGGLYNVGAVGGSSAEGGGFYTTGAVGGFSAAGGGFYSAGAVNSSSAAGSESMLNDRIQEILLSSSLKNAKSVHVNEASSTIIIHKVNQNTRQSP